MKKYALILMSILCSSVTLNAANLIVNGDFANGLNGWSAFNSDIGEGLPNPTTFIVSSGAAAGNLCIQGAYDGDGSGVYQIVEIGSEAHTYTLSYNYGYTNIGSVSGVMIKWYDCDELPVPGETSPIPGVYVSKSFDWTTLPDPAPLDTVYNNSSGNTWTGVWSILIPAEFTLVRANVNDPEYGHPSLMIPKYAKWAEIRLLQYATGYRTYFKNVSLEQGPLSCGQSGTIYLKGDINKDCYVNFEDIAELGLTWLTCNDVTNPNCSN